MSISPELIELVRCPRCHGELRLRGAQDAGDEGFECAACRLLYPVIDDIPQFLIDEARPL